MVTEKQIEQLSAKLSQENVSKREGAGGKELSYVEGHYAIRTANEIFGFDGWDGRQLELRLIGQCEVNGKIHIAYSCTYAIDALGTRKEDTGYGDGTDKNPLKAHELAMKEAVTDARKRCLMMFGDQFGLALYDKKQEHVEKPGKAPEPKQEKEQFINAVEAFNLYSMAHDRYGFPTLDKEVMNDLKGVLGVDQSSKITAEGWIWLTEWAERVHKGLDDIPILWTDRVKVALSNGANS